MNSTMGIWFLRVSNFQGYSKISSFSRDERSFLRESKIQNFTVPGQSFSKFQGCSRVSISRASRVKGSHLRVSTLVHTPIYRLLLAAMLDHVTTGNDGRVRTGCTARVRAQMDGWPLSPLTPQSLTTPQPQHRLQIA